MAQLTQNKFLQGLPEIVLSNLPQPLQGHMQARQPWRWLVQFHVGEPKCTLLYSER